MSQLINILVHSFIEHDIQLMDHQDHNNLSKKDESSCNQTKV